MPNSILNKKKNENAGYDDGIPEKKQRLNNNASFEQQLNFLKTVLPNADPEYLEMKCNSFDGDVNELNEFVNDAVLNGNYPNLKDYKKRIEMKAQITKYTENFNIEEYLKIIPNPLETFSDKNRKYSLDDFSIEYAFSFLKNNFRRLPLKMIKKVFWKKPTLFVAYLELKNQNISSNLMKRTRAKTSLPNRLQNIPLLQEITYINHLNEINNYITQKKENDNIKFIEYKSKNLLKICGCCFDAEVMPENIVQCKNKCEFCRQCIVQYVEINYGDGNLDIKCPLNCLVDLDLKLIQDVMSPVFFSKFALKKAVQEVKNADIDDLEMCPFCDFAIIPAENDKLFRCFNPECMKESCRTCKEPNHIPLKCEELENDVETKARVFVENQMTEALLRTCYKCGIKFFKEEGCNMMQCRCGAKMCYLCKKPVQSYNHFKENNGFLRFGVCPLFTNTIETNRNNVIKGATAAMATITAPLKSDPTKDVNKYFDEICKKKFFLCEGTY